MAELQIIAGTVGLVEVAMGSLAMLLDLGRALEQIHDIDGAQFSRHASIQPWSGVVPGVLKRHTPARDEEQAGDHQKEPFEFESGQADSSQGQRRGGGINWLRLVRNVAGVLLLYPTCMLVMSNYAVTRGLLQGCSRLDVPPLGVSRYSQKPSTDLLTNVSIRYHSCRNACSDRHHSHFSAQASSGRYSSTFITTATLKTNSRNPSWVEQLFSDCYYALDARGMRWVSCSKRCPGSYIPVLSPAISHMVPGENGAVQRDRWLFLEAHSHHSPASAPGCHYHAARTISWTMLVDSRHVRQKRADIHHQL